MIALTLAGDPLTLGPVEENLEHDLDKSRRAGDDRDVGIKGQGTDGEGQGQVSMYGGVWGDNGSGQWINKPQGYP